MHDLNDAELDAFLDRVRHSLADQAREMSRSPEPGDIRAAMDTTLSMLVELRNVRPEKRSRIDPIIAAYSA